MSLAIGVEFQQLDRVGNCRFVGRPVDARDEIDAVPRIDEKPLLPAGQIPDIDSQDVGLLAEAGQRAALLVQADALERDFVAGRWALTRDAWEVVASG